MLLLIKDLRYGYSLGECIRTKDNKRFLRLMNKSNKKTKGVVYTDIWL